MIVVRENIQDLILIEKTGIKEFRRSKLRNMIFSN